VQFSPFDELLTEGFDNEQIWEELALQNNPFIAYAKEQLEYFEEEEESHSSDDIDGANEDSDLEAMDETEEFGENLASDETADFEDALEEQPDEAEDEEEYGEDEEEEEDNFEDIEAADESDDALDLEEFDERYFWLDQYVLCTLCSGLPLMTYPFFAFYFPDQLELENPPK
jgi:U3 small nucleolar RNA-associated protein MPP10